MTDINEQKTARETELSIGKRLRLCREQKKITIVEVASQLRLLKENIENIESDQWDKLHGRAYARGYFLSYVRFLGLPEIDMLEAFDHEYKSSSQESNAAIVMLDKEKKGRPWLSFLFILIVISVIVSAYFQRHQPEIDDVQTDTSVSEERSFAESVIKPISENYTETVAMLMDKFTNTAALILDDVNSIMEKIKILVGAEVSSSENMNKNRISESLSQDNSSEIVHEEISDVPTDRIEQQAVIGLQFNDDCWVEVTDKNGETVINEVMKVGTSILLSGPQPFTVVLSNASAVEVLFNGEDFDISTFVKNDVARFNIGEE